MGVVSERTISGMTNDQAPQKKASPDDPGEAFSLSGHCPDQPSSDTIPSVSPVPVQPS